MFNLYTNNDAKNNNLWFWIKLFAVTASWWAAAYPYVQHICVAIVAHNPPWKMYLYLYTDKPDPGGQMNCSLAYIFMLCKENT